MPLHTQREEDIKAFDEYIPSLATCIQQIGYVNTKVQIIDFISNIYIKIAEAQIKRWTEIFDYHQDMANENDTYKRNTARVEITYWQEELNKLK